MAIRRKQASSKGCLLSWTSSKETGKKDSLTLIEPDIWNSSLWKNESYSFYALQISTHPYFKLSD